MRAIPRVWERDRYITLSGNVDGKTHGKGPYFSLKQSGDSKKRSTESIVRSQQYRLKMGNLSTALPGKMISL
jgi:hypothetical protein